MKQCSKCKKWKHESEFGIHRCRKDGLRYYCKKCECEAAHKYYDPKRKRIGTYTTYKQRHRLVNGLKQKRCGRCKKWKAESEFYKNRRHKDGLAYRCKDCADKATNECRRRLRLPTRN